MGGRRQDILPYYLLLPGRSWSIFTSPSWSVQPTNTHDLHMDDWHCGTSYNTGIKLLSFLEYQYLSLQTSLKHMGVSQFLQPFKSVFAYKNHMFSAICWGGSILALRHPLSLGILLEDSVDQVRPFNSLS